MKYLEMKHVKKQFDGLEVLKDISLSVEEGEVTAIIGPSGSGKSTLLRCATMLEEMDDGELYYLGEQAAKSENGRAKTRCAQKNAPILWSCLSELQFVSPLQRFKKYYRRSHSCAETKERRGWGAGNETSRSDGTFR